MSNTDLISYGFGVTWVGIGMIILADRGYFLDFAPLLFGVIFGVIGMASILAPKFASTDSVGDPDDFANE